MQKTINDIPLKEAETNQEKQLLGFLEVESQRIGYGKLTIEFSMRAGKMDRMKLIEREMSVNIGRRDGG